MIKMEISYYEIYNEQVNDLLARKKSEGENLKLREHPKQGVFVSGGT